MSTDEEGFNGASASWIARSDVLGGWDKAPIGVPIVPQVSTERSAGIPQETSLTELVRLMIEKGCSPEMILMATALYEKNSLGIPRNSSGTTQENKDFTRAERVREKDRERKRQAKLAAGNSNGIPDSEKRDIYKEDKIDTEVEDKKVSKKVLKYEFGFDDFWLAYPRTPVMSKAEAYAVWKKLSPEDRKAATASVQPFKDYLKKQKPDFMVIHAVRFLKYRRFDGFASLPANDFNSEEYQAARRRALDAIKGT